MGDGGAGRRAAGPGALARGGALSDHADHVRASRGVYGAGDAVPHASRREPSRPGAPHRVLRVRRRWAACWAARQWPSSRRSRSRRSSSTRSRSPRRCSFVPRACRRIAWRNRRSTLGVACRRGMLFVAGYWSISVFNERAGVELTQPLIRIVVRDPGGPAVVTRADGAALRRHDRRSARRRRRHQNRRRSAPPRTHVFRRARSHVPAERRLARAYARHDDARRAGVSRQGSHTCPLPTTIHPGRSAMSSSRSRPKDDSAMSVSIGLGAGALAGVRRQRCPHGLLRD